VSQLCQDDHQEETISNTIPLGDNSIVVTNSALSNFSASVIYDMQVLGIVPTKVQQTMNFLSESWANMAQNDEIVELDENTSQPFQGGCFLPFASLVCFFYFLLSICFTFMEGFGFCPPSYLYFFFLYFNI